MQNVRMSAIVLMILGAAATRLLPHPYNFTCITALALFGGAHFSDRRLAFAVPLLALVLSNVALGWIWSLSSLAYASHSWVQYASFALVVPMGLSLRGRTTLLRTAGTTLAASTMFYLVSNFGVWLFDAMYAKSLAGLVECYVAAIPFFGNALAGDAFYTGLLFGGIHLLESRFASLREPQPLGA